MHMISIFKKNNSLIETNIPRLNTLRMCSHLDLIVKY